MNLNSIKHVILAFKGPAGGTPGRGGFASAIGRITQQLETLNRSTERDFLAVGEKLREFRAAARQIQSGLAEVTELISGEQGRNASHALAQMLERSKDMDARIERSGPALTGVSELSVQLRRAFSGLPNMVSVFRALCTLTRIETSRLGGTGADLGHLAAEIIPLSESIQASGKGVMENSLQLDQKVQSALRSGAELRIAQLQEMPALIAGVLDSLRSLEERRQLALESSQRQATQYAEVCAAIDDLVGSIQFHDITRQQVEHVVEALRQVRAGPGSRDIRAILTLQSSQLAGSARTFASSIDRMQRDLENIAARVEHASEAVQSLMGLSGGDRDSFFVKMENQFSAILKMFGACTAAQAEMDATATGLEATIGHMRSAVNEIRGTEIRIQRISTNATIRATHIGAGGVALNKIAEVMQHLALESNTNTEEVARMLDTMSKHAGGVSASTGPEALAAADQVVEQMQRTAGELHASSESSFSRVNQIAALGSQLATEIGAVRGELTAGRMFAAVADRVQIELAEICLPAGHAATAGDSVSTKEHLEHFAKTYTMQSQRDVHESVLAGVSTPAPSAPAASKAASGEDGLGDNVDLF